MSVFVQAQSFKLYKLENSAPGNEIASGTTLSYTCFAEEEEDGTFHAAAETYIFLENASDIAKMVVCKREIIEMADAAAETYFCWGICDPNPLDTMAETTVSETSKTLLSTHYTAPLVEGRTLVRYTFYDKEHPEDSVSVVFEYITPADLRTPLYVGAVALSVYPNPTVDFLTIETDNLQLKQAAIVLYDATGRKVKTQLLTSNATKINVNNLERGIYLLQIVNENQTIGVRRFIKE